MSKVAVITGASGGIGAAVARRLAAQGCYVVLGYCRSREKAESLCRELREAGGEAVSFRADLTKAEEAKALIEFAVQQYGHLDILVNNAGISQIKLFTDITQEDWQRMFAANVDGIYHCCRAAVPVFGAAAQRHHYQCFLHLGAVRRLLRGALLRLQGGGHRLYAGAG